MAKQCERCFKIGYDVSEKKIKGQKYTVCNPCALAIATGR